MKQLIFLLLIFFFLSLHSFPLEKENETGLIIYIHNDIDNTGCWINTTLFKALDTLSEKLFEKLKSSSIIKDLKQDFNCSCESDPVYVVNPEGLPASCNYYPAYTIIGSVKTFNHLIYAAAKIYFIYQVNPLKYLELFELKTKYYNKNDGVLIEKITAEILKQLKAGLDDNINVFIDSMKIDINQKENAFLKNAVPEYLKSRLAISDKIKVHIGTITTPVPGVSKKPQYTVNGYVFDDRDRVHIVVHCNDNDEDRVIISKQISFSIENPDSLEIKLLEIGDEFRNAILTLYNSKIHKRKTGFAIVAVPPFFSNPENADVAGMNSINKKIIYSFISGFRTNSIMYSNFEFVSDPHYFFKVDEYLNNNKEFSVITNELNAEKLIILQTIGNPEEFDISLQLYNPIANYELSNIAYIEKVKSSKILSPDSYYSPNPLDFAYDAMNVKLLESIMNEIETKPGSSKIDDTTAAMKSKQPEKKIDIKPSDFYELIPKKLGLEIEGLHSLLFDDQQGKVFLGNHLRPAIEIAGYYSFPFWWGIPSSINLSFMYDFGHSREYKNYGDTTNHTGTVYGRNINCFIKLYASFNNRIKNDVRFYLGLGGTLIDIHRVSTRESAGSFEPGWIGTIGLEYNFTSKLYLDFNARFLKSFGILTTLNEYSDTRTEVSYTAFFLGAGIGYEF
jgi:hypothetical protein